ncbi:MAG TPA: SCP2 sterol-binding domain-containing protein [Gaiellaceae bacterium]|jgi:putative sterol carrier protein|nr:SCP2 sterol-binding domain-containing protein [Gaiellaceae bacterium]
MRDATTEFFAGLEERGHEPLLEKATGSLRFDLIDNGRRARWLVEIDHGDLTVSHRNAKADCVVRAEQALFDRIAAGEENAVAAVLRGAMGIEGNRQLLVLFQRLFPAPKSP